NLAEYEGYVKERLTPRRFEHSLGVMKTMEALAPIYSLDLHQARLAGLLHDAAKELPDSEWMSLVKDNEQLLLDSKEYDYHRYLHGPVGVIVIQRDLHVEDEEVLEAIATHGYHGPWEAFNRPLSWCLRFSDILEPGRDWRNNHWLRELVFPLREAAYGGRLQEAALMITRRLVEWYEHDGVAIHPNIRRVAKEFVGG
ncbi:MAG TPA: bis(5'-nucleosyl)-tetraphosphatase (symmetrical) YqeK, partial [Anaerolineales bacterium]|nr:bis(5'-nucleosyl)-tetraphosphatase (symmetrical) YqeK [Anaerolineales bacterium]